MWDLDDLFDDFSDWDNLFHDFLGWYWNLNRHDNLPFNFNHFRIVDSHMDYFLHLDVARNFLYDFNDFLNNNLVVDNLFFVLGNFD